MASSKKVSGITFYKLVLTVGAAVFAMILQYFSLLKSWDNKIFDTEIQWVAHPVSDQIVIIAIDEYSLEKLGKWPWSRRTHAELINVLRGAKVKAVGMDIIFAEPDRQDPAADAELIQAISKNSRVVLPVLPRMDADRTLQISLPWPQLTRVAAGLGHVDIELDSDGVVRSAYLSAGMAGRFWPAFAAALLAVDHAASLHYLPGIRMTEEQSLPELWQRDFRIEMPFPRLPQSFRQISYADVLSNPQLAAALQDKFVLVGMTAAGLGQKFTTPLYKNAGLTSGVEIHANLLNVLLNDNAIVALSPILCAILTGLLVLIPIATYNFFIPRQALLLSVAFSGLGIATSLGLLSAGHYWYGPASALSTLLMSFLLWNWKRLQFFSRLLFRERQLAKTTLHSISEAVITTNNQGLIVYMNPAAEELTGLSQEKAKGLLINSVLRFVSKHSGQNIEPSFEELTNRFLLDQAVKEVEPRYILSQSGQEYAVQFTVSPLKEPLGKISGAVFVITDITEILQISRRIAYLAEHDSLTGLVNRAVLSDQIEKAIKVCSRQKHYFAILFIDLDDFKKVNDGMGHRVGDLLLAEVAARLLSNVRQVDTVARWGGDEFVVLLNLLPFEENITAIIAQVLERLSHPYCFEGQTLHITASIGISVFPKDGLTAEELLVHADAALFQVKENGRNNVSFYSNQFIKAVQGHLEMEKALYRALEENQFEVVYQPQVDAHSNTVIGAEALLRWHHPDKGMIAPVVFIPVAEKTGLINEIGKWVWQTVCAQLSQWRQQQLPEIVVAVNFSPRQFQQANLLSDLAKALHDNQIPAGLLHIEITENLMIKNVDAVIKMLEDIRALGIRIAIDDFGTGYSSFKLLKDFPVDQLKIDKCFIDQLNANSMDAQIAQFMIKLGQTMNIKVVAEGVETREQLDLLLKWNCHYIQGYYFSRPLSAEKMADYLKQANLSHKAG